MQPMTHKERVLNTLNRRPVDQLPCYDGLWGETRKKYEDEGRMRPGEWFNAHFDLSLGTAGWVDGVADRDFVPQLIEETEETILKLDGNGARLRWWKNKAGTPEHVGFSVEDRQGWEERIKPHLLKLDMRRIDVEGYRGAKQATAERNMAFGWAGVAPFEQMHPVCGHENMLAGMALDPDWIKDMVMTYADFTIRHLEELFAREGLPDFAWFYEDMGFKEKPFMSPAMYQEIVEPGHKKLFDYMHSKRLKVVVHSCGFVEPLVPGLIRAGMDCLQAMEVKAGMDVVRLAGQFGDRISFFGGVDIREVASNDRARIDAEFQRRVVPLLKTGRSYILHSDHSIPPDVEYDTLRYFFEKGRRLTANS